MNTVPITFQKVLDALLSDNAEFPRHYLKEFSDIGPVELQSLLDVWPRIKPRRKLTLFEELKSLAEADTLVSFDDLARAFLTDPDPHVRTRAVRLLDESEDPKLVAIFLDMLQNDQHVDVRAEAASVLSLFVNMGELEEISEQLYHQMEEALLAAANGRDDGRVRRAALESLGYSSRPEVVTLIDSAFHREDPSWRASAIVAMGRSADERWEDEVTTSLISEDDDVKRVAVQSAGELGLKSARLVLIRLLEEEDDEELTNAAISSLSQIGGEDARTYLEALLDQTEEDQDQVEFLEEALDNLSFTEDLDRFELMAIDPDADLEELEEIDELEEAGEAEEDDE